MSSFVIVGHGAPSRFQLVAYDTLGFYYRCHPLILHRPGHEDLDQVFSQQGAFIGRHTWDCPEDVVRLMDSTYRPEDPGERERKRARAAKVDVTALKLDNVALWKDWVAVLGLRFRGLRCWAAVLFTLLGFVFDV